MKRRTLESTAADLESIVDQVKEGIRSGKYTLQELQSELVERTKDMARTTDDYVHENPWQMIGIAVGVGLLIGVVLQQRR